jgi:hypothetical protein
MIFKATTTIPIVFNVRRREVPESDAIGRKADIACASRACRSEAIDPNPTLVGIVLRLSFQLRRPLWVCFE